MEDTFKFVKSECDRLGFPVDCYKLGKSPSAGLGEIGLDFRDRKWLVFLFERGREEDVCTFESVRSAVEHFFFQINLVTGNNLLSAVNLGDLPK